jgi:hypothetical protein
MSMVMINYFRNSEKYSSVSVDPQEIVLKKAFVGGCARGGTCKTYTLYGDGRFGDKKIDQQAVMQIVYAIEHNHWKDYKQDSSRCQAPADGIDEAYTFGTSTQIYYPCGIAIPWNDDLRSALRVLPY